MAAKAKANKAWKEWLTAELDKGAGLARKFTQPAEDVTHEVVVGADGMHSSNPRAIQGKLQKQWKQVWQASEVDGDGRYSQVCRQYDRLLQEPELRRLAPSTRSTWSAAPRSTAATYSR